MGSMFKNPKQKSKTKTDMDPHTEAIQEFLLPLMLQRFMQTGGRQQTYGEYQGMSNPPGVGPRGWPLPNIQPTMFKQFPGLADSLGLGSTSAPGMNDLYRMLLQGGGGEGGPTIPNITDLYRGLLQGGR